MVGSLNKCLDKKSLIKKKVVVWSLSKSSAGFELLKIISSTEISGFIEYIHTVGPSVLKHDEIDIP
jgi:hypothetical protein